MGAIEELASRVKRPAREVELVVDGEAAARVDEAERRLDQALRSAVDEDGGLDDASPLANAAAELQAELDDARDAVAITVVRVQAVSRRRFTELQIEHPPTAEQRRLGIMNNGQTLQIALVGEGVVAIDGVEVPSEERTYEAGETLHDQLAHGQWERLALAAWEVNGGSGIPKSGPATGPRPASGRSSTTAPPEGSPGPSS